MFHGGFQNAAIGRKSSKYSWPHFGPVLYIFHILRYETDSQPDNPVGDLEVNPVFKFKFSEPIEFKPVGLKKVHLLVSILVTFYTCRFRKFPVIFSYSGGNSFDIPSRSCHVSICGADVSICVRNGSCGTYLVVCPKGFT